MVVVHIWTLLAINLWANGTKANNLFKRSNPEIESIVNSNRQAPQIEGYHVSIAKYDDRYYQKEYEGADQSKLDEIQYKIDMLHRKSSQEIMAYSQRQLQRATQLRLQHNAARSKMLDATRKRKAHQGLKTSIEMGRQVSDQQIDSIYQGSFGDDEASSSTSSGLANRFAGLMGCQKPDKTKKRKGKVKSKEDSQDSNSVYNKRVMQHKAAIMALAPPTYFDIVKSRNKALRLGKDVMEGSERNEKHERAVMKAYLKEKAVLDRDVTAIQHLINQYNKSAQRHQAEKIRLERWYRFMRNKARIWKVEAQQYTALAIPDLTGYENESTILFSDDDDDDKGGVGAGIDSYD